MGQGEQGRPSRRFGLAGTGSFKAPDRRDLVPAPVKKALVIDDDPDMVKLIGTLLGTLGLQILPAYDAMQGLIVAQREDPALIVVDLHMPAGGGLRLLEKLKASARTGDIPIVVVTADATSDLPKKVRELGARDFVRKPIDPESFLRTIRQHLT